MVQSRAVPAFVGADIAGAVIGACSSGIGSYVTSDSVNWKSVAWCAASGAVIGSTGVVGKVGKWISKLFNIPQKLPCKCRSSQYCGITLF